MQTPAALAPPRSALPMGSAPSLARDADATQLGGFAVNPGTGRGHAPAGMLSPRSTDDVLKALAWAAKTGAGLVPVSSTGTHRRGDTVPQQEGVVMLDLSGMNRLLQADGGERIAVIEAGVDFGQVDTLLAPHGLRALRPLMPRAGKSVIASYLEREPLIAVNEHWDATDPFGGTMLVLGNGRATPTGTAAIEGTLAEQWARGHRHMVSLGPSNLDLVRVLQGAQGTLGVMTWAAVYCERIPVQEEAFFCGADTLAPAVNLCRELLWRKLANALFIVDRVQLALMLAPDRAAFTSLLPQLPAWTVFASISAGRLQTEAKMAWQRADLHSCAAQHGVQVHEQLGGHRAQALIAGLRRPEPQSFRDRAFGAHRELFFIHQLDQVQKHVNTVRNTLDAAGKSDAVLGVYVQPMTQGVNCHVEFTWAAPRGANEQRDADLWHTAAQCCAEEGGFFSRPYGRWAEIAYERDGGNARTLMRLAKAQLDPQGLMNPGRLPY